MKHFKSSFFSEQRSATVAAIQRHVMAYHFTGVELANCDHFVGPETRKAFGTLLTEL
jgi:hypothetical protein